MVLPGAPQNPPSVVRRPVTLLDPALIERLTREEIVRALAAIPDGPPDWGW